MRRTPRRVDNLLRCSGVAAMSRRARPNLFQGTYSSTLQNIMSPLTEAKRHRHRQREVPRDSTSHPAVRRGASERTSPELVPRPPRDGLPPDERRRHSADSPAAAATRARRARRRRGHPRPLQAQQVPLASVARSGGLGRARRRRRDASHWAGPRRASPGREGRGTCHPRGVPSAQRARVPVARRRRCTHTR